MALIARGIVRGTSSSGRRSFSSCPPRPLPPRSSWSATYDEATWKDEGFRQNSHLWPKRRLHITLPSAMSSNTTADSSPKTFSLSPVEAHNKPLGEGNVIKTAACLIIGDEILNGKTQDTNSNYFAKFCFENGIELKRIEVVPDVEEEIVDAAKRLTEKYDFVLTSGGIGPTHDDITYESLAAAFNMPLKHDEETMRRMAELSHHRKAISNQTAEQKEARNRMALFPYGEDAEVLFVLSDFWVPIVRLKGKLCILPGVPSLFRRLLTGLTPYLPISEGSRPSRVLVFTKLPESSIAPYLTSLQKRVSSQNIRVGSYPKMYKGVAVSLIGPDAGVLKELSQEVAKELQGAVVESDEHI